MWIMQIRQKNDKNLARMCKNKHNFALSYKYLAYLRLVYLALREKCLYSQFFWFISSPIWAGTEKLRIRTLFTQCRLSMFDPALRKM